MRLYLSSYGLGNHPERFASLVGSNKRTAVIANAWDLASDVERAGGLPAKIEMLQGLGLHPEELDLRHYFGKYKALKKRLQDYGALWILGGNSFVLLRAMNMSGFTHCIPELLESTALVYAGYSAGIVVAAPDLRGIELVDDPEPVPENYAAEIPWTGLALNSFRIAPHYRSDHPESEAIEKVVAYFEANQLPYKTLRDGEALVIRDGSVELVG